MTKRKPCLAEEWFVEEGLEDIQNQPAAYEHALLRLFECKDAKTALSKIYEMSRAIRVNHIMAGRFELARKTDNWAALRVMLLIESLVGLATENFYGSEVGQRLLRKARHERD